MKVCAFCAYRGDEPQFGEHVRSAHGFIPQADLPSLPDLQYGVRFAVAGPQLLALGVVLLFVFGIGWATGSYYINFMWYGPSMNLLQVLAFLCLPVGLVCLGAGSIMVFNEWTRGSTGRDEDSQEGPSVRRSD